jgi:hypothetical protein
MTRGCGAALELAFRIVRSDEERDRRPVLWCRGGRNYGVKMTTQGLVKFVALCCFGYLLVFSCIHFYTEPQAPSFMPFYHVYQALHGSDVYLSDGQGLEPPGPNVWGVLVIVSMIGVVWSLSSGDTDAKVFVERPPDGLELAVLPNSASYNRGFSRAIFSGCQDIAHGRPGL